ncbi:hypothetical protein BJV78DRAFT_1260475 [Lactifluus subvellereus]|nr:hypothetical protein BJV78DRAFT_1270915 [Lactifluus subvellereus]KAI0245779.1 hypothetical protein BJV78DRAFT_1260475 [Lactifluus subvellereus]
MLCRLYTLWQVSFTSHATVQSNLRFRLIEELIDFREPDMDAYNAGHFPASYFTE